MQSIRNKALLFILIGAVITLFVAAMLHEPKLVQTSVEQKLDASAFKQ